MTPCGGRSDRNDTFVDRLVPDRGRDRGVIAAYFEAIWANVIIELDQNKTCVESFQMLHQ